MQTLRKYTEKNGILVFDSSLDESLSAYDSENLEEIAKIEAKHFWFSRRREKISSIFGAHIEKNARILEIGAGTGFIAEKIQEMGYDIEVSDCYSNGLIWARKRGIKTLYQFDLFNPPFHERFDVICLFDVLEHLKDPKLALTKIKQMLKPGGKIVLTVPAHMFLWSREDTIAGHQTRYSKNELKRLFCCCNLTPVYCKYFFILIAPLLYLRKLIYPDHGNPIGPNEKFHFRIPKSMNGILHSITKFEFLLERWFPNVIGGSLLAIAQKDKSCI